MTFNSYIINDEVIFNMDVNELQPVAGKDHEAITLNTPTARCLQLLLESNGNIISRDEFLSAVWKERGVVVSQNTFYQNISLLRKSLLRAGLTQDVVVTVRQRGFVIATGTVIRQVTLQNEFNSAQPLSTDASMRIINDKYIAKIDDAEVQNSVKKNFQDQWVNFTTTIMVDLYYCSHNGHNQYNFFMLQIFLISIEV